MLFQKSQIHHLYVAVYNLQLYSTIEDIYNQHEKAFTIKFTQVMAYLQNIFLNIQK